MARFVELGHVLEGNPPLLDPRGHLATCIHAPFSRFEDGPDLNRIPLAAIAGVPGMVLDAPAKPGALTLELDRQAVKDRAVIIRDGMGRSLGDGPILGARAVSSSRDRRAPRGRRRGACRCRFLQHRRRGRPRGPGSDEPIASRSTRRRAPLQPSGPPTGRVPLLRHPAAYRRRSLLSSAGVRRGGFGKWEFAASTSRRGRGLIAMLRETWWWPWWVSSLIDLAIVFAALLVFHFSARRLVRALAALLVVAGAVAAVLAPVVMTDRPDRHMRNEPAMRAGIQ
jgi:hypothetical protein